MLESLLIANRGEIACRIMRTARAMGIRTVAVYSDADRQALHVRQADDAVHIGTAPVRESYLRGDRIIAAARESGAQAIHPGYGFLSENADFAQAVIDAGLIWVGPRPDSIRAMGLKDAAKALMQKAGVPTTPGYLGEDQSAERLRAQADAIGYPLLIKAVAGGGGKGMRKVDDSADFAEALASCRREAASGFGNDAVLLEKWITDPRHIEVQIFGDTHGNVVHLFERDCSLQRRHQKVMEEAPAPGMDATTRAAICDAAVRAAKAVDYVGAGTIEFIADASDGLRADRIWFMEMNTRLQVEHPVTEAITGVDLVEWQLRIASGEPVPVAQDALSITGWAVEARLYAEDPASGFLPSTGRLDHIYLPARTVRVDTGVMQGAVISPWYDPMIAKLIAHADTRRDALDALERALEQVAIWPVKSNAGFLHRCVADPVFRDGGVTTGFIGDNLDRLIPAPLPSPAMLGEAARLLSDDSVAPGLRGFRLNAVPDPRVRLRSGKERFEATLFSDPASGIRAVRLAPDCVVVSAQGQSFAIALDRTDSAASGGASDGAILSPMPGRIIAVSVAEGDPVVKGQRLLTLEAMKMEHSLSAPFDGVVANLDAQEGGQVSEGTILVRIVPKEG